MVLFLYLILGSAAFVAYLVLGTFIGATVFKRSNASWRWWNSNIGEFFFFLGSPLSLVVYHLGWPLWIAMELFARLVRSVQKGTLFKRRKVVPSNTKKYDFTDTDFASLYPTTMKPKDDDYYSGYPTGGHDYKFKELRQRNSEKE